MSVDDIRRPGDPDLRSLPNIVLYGGARAVFISYGGLGARQFGALVALGHGDGTVSVESTVRKHADGSPYIEIVPSAFGRFVDDVGAAHGADEAATVAALNLLFERNVAAVDLDFDPVGTSLSGGNVQACLAELGAAVAAIAGAPMASGVATLLSSNVGIAGGETAGVADPTNSTAGWYFKNTTDVTDKINWYYMGGVANAMTLGDVDGQHAVLDVRAAASPFFQLWTARENDGQDAGAWYRSRLAYAPNPSFDISAYVGQEVLFYWGTDPGVFPGLTRVECVLQVADPGTVGPRDAAESILLGGLVTSTGNAAGAYEFVAGELAYTYASKTDTFLLSAPSAAGGADPVVPDSAYIELDGVNDYVALSGTGAVLDFTSTWTVGIEIVSMPSVTTDAKFMTIFRSGNSAVTLRRGGSNWGLYLMGGANGYYSVGQANTWYAPSAGSKVLFHCDGVRLKYWLDGTMRANIAMNTTYRDSSEHVFDSLEIGKGGIGFAQGANVSLEGGIDNLVISYNALSTAEIAEFFTSSDATSHSYYSSARDFVPLGEGGYPNVSGTKNNVTGTLVNGTSDDFQERI